MISLKIFEAPVWNLSEILRYARTKPDDTSLVLIDECIKEAGAVLSYKVCYTVEDVIRDGDYSQIGKIRIKSNTLERTLSGCEQALIFAATVGSPFDRLTAKYSKLSPSKAVIMHAIGAERAEALCDAFCRSFEAETGYRLNRRVSPGYGDLALETQREVFSMLECPRKIGLTLNGSLLMSPSKSVTAVAGIVSADRGRLCGSQNNCDNCDKIDCGYRK